MITPKRPESVSWASRHYEKTELSFGCLGNDAVFTAVGSGPFGNLVCFVLWWLPWQRHFPVWDGSLNLDFKANTPLSLSLSLSLSKYV